VAEWAMLEMFYDQDPISLNQLAAQMGMTRGAITKLAELFTGPTCRR
jgi:DNA-binding MarR family transcriptional regulator